MSSLSALVTTSLYLTQIVMTSFSTIYQTSTPTTLTTITSPVSQADTIHSTATITQPEVILTSTIAVPTTLTDTMSLLLTSTPSNLPPPATRTFMVTSTVTTTIIDPQPTITYYPPFTTPPLASSFTITTTEKLTVYPIQTTVTFTQLELILLSSGATSPTPYTTITTILPLNPLSTDVGDVIVIPTSNDDHGWNTWTYSEKGGLIAGVVIAGLLILGLLAWCLMRRRNVWLASEWVGPPPPMMQQQMIVSQQQRHPGGYAYWGPGPNGWGLRGGGNVSEEK